MRWHKGRLSTFHRAHKMKKKISAAANYSQVDEREADRKRKKSLLPAAWEEVEVADLFPTPRLGT